MKTLARKLRRNQTDAERLLWSYLRAHLLAGFKFRRQQAIGQYIVDFVCFEARLIVEADGGQHVDQLTEDGQRTAALGAMGYRVLRYWNHEILTDIQSILSDIHHHLIHTPSPQPSPGGRGIKIRSSPD
jgi:very-short-patch-repair endonuclease